MCSMCEDGKEIAVVKYLHGVSDMVILYKTCCRPGFVASFTI